MDDLAERYASLAAIASRGPVRSGARAGERALSALEQSIWSVARSMPPSFGLIEGGMRLRGVLDVAALERAIDLLNTRYDVLRTSYHEVAGAPIARVAPHVAGRLLNVDCSSAENGAEGGPAKMAAELIARERDVGFNLERAPLMRFVLLRFGADEHLLYHFCHHVVLDGRAYVLLHRDLGEAYRAFKHGENPSLREPPLQYDDFVSWQRSWRTPAIEHGYRAFWHTQLGDTPSAAPVADMVPRPSGQVRFHCGRALRTFDASDVLPFTALCAKRQWPLPSALLAAMVAVLYEEGDEDPRIVVFSGNRRRETMSIVGSFSTLLPTRVPRKAGESLSDLFDRTARALGEGLRHQDLAPTFAELLEAGCRSIFNYWGMHGASLDLEGLEVTELDSDERSHVQFDVELNCSLTEGDGLRVFVEYNRELIKPAQMDAFLERYARVIHSIIAQIAP